MVLNLSGVDTKTFTAHSTRTALSSKAKEAGVSTGEISKRGFWSKESTFEKFYHKGINKKDPHFNYLFWKAFTRGRLKDDFRFQAWWGAKLVLGRAEISWNEILELRLKREAPCRIILILNKIEANDLIHPPSSVNLIIIFF